MNPKSENTDSLTSRCIWGPSSRSAKATQVGSPLGFQIARKGLNGGRRTVNMTHNQELNKHRQTDR